LEIGDLEQFDKMDLLSYNQRPECLGDSLDSVISVYGNLSLRID
jgi:hypothetical protein